MLLLRKNPYSIQYNKLTNGGIFVGKVYHIAWVWLGMSHQ